MGEGWALKKERGSIVLHPFGENKKEWEEQIYVALDRVS
jgi:hypothetical protein